jgi:hypothetical protein
MNLIKGKKNIYISYFIIFLKKFIIGGQRIHNDVVLKDKLKNDD